MSGLLDVNEVAILAEIRRVQAENLAIDDPPLDVVEAGAIVHEFGGVHDRDERCLGCAAAGRPLLEKARQGQAGTDPGPRNIRGNIHGEPGLVRERASTPPRARANDPSTSHAAAASLCSLTDRQQAILDLFWAVGRMTDEEVEHHYGERDEPEQSLSGLRTRRHELVEQGFIWDTLERRPTATGRASIVWGLTAAGLAATRNRAA